LSENKPNKVGSPLLLTSFAASYEPIRHIGWFPLVNEVSRTDRRIKSLHAVATPVGFAAHDSVTHRPAH
jgi:hypothetical protein